MTSKQTVEYLRSNISKWEQVFESLEHDDKFREMCTKKIDEAHERIKAIVRKESPEDFLH
jgi:tRNA U34 5-carboxymethylaminomethyl modifying GTPase MnmE/TrmE